MLSKNLDKLRIAPYMKEYLTRSTNASVNKYIEYYTRNDYLAEKYITHDFEKPKREPFFGLFLFIASSVTFYFLSKKTNDN